MLANTRRTISTAKADLSAESSAEYSLFVFPSVYYSLHQRCLECVCSHFRCACTHPKQQTPSKLIWSTDIDIKPGPGVDVSQNKKHLCSAETHFTNPDGMVCLHYQSRLCLFSHLHLCDKQIVAISLWVWGGNCGVFFPHHSGDNKGRSGAQQESNGRLMVRICWKGRRNLAPVLETSSRSNMCLFIVIHTHVEEQQQDPLNVIPVKTVIMRVAN